MQGNATTRQARSKKELSQQKPEAHLKCLEIQEKKSWLLQRFKGKRLLRCQSTFLPWPLL